jgi:hypothetical protein
MDKDYNFVSREHSGNNIFTKLFYARKCSKFDRNLIGSFAQSKLARITQSLHAHEESRLSRT